MVVPELDFDVRLAIVRVFRSPEFRHYVDHRGEIEQRVEADAEEINEAVFGARYEHGIGDRTVVTWDELVDLLLRAFPYILMIVGVRTAAEYLWSGAEAELSRLHQIDWLVITYKNWGRRRPRRCRHRPLCRPGALGVIACRRLACGELGHGRGGKGLRVMACRNGT